MIYVAAIFNGGQDANGFGTWPSSWPSYVTCSKTVGSDTHTYTIPLVDAPSGTTRVVLPPVTSVITLATGSSITVPASYDPAGRRYINLPDGNYTGPSTSTLVAAKTSGGATYPYVKCGVASMADDYLVVYAHESSANGTAYCPVTKDGTNYLIPITVSTP